ncbi:MAG: winged helix-turn-helix domain-containing protein [Janthinobacterium lividum]
MAITGPLKLNVQLLRDGEPAIGPGKALVLDAIDRAGSISAAGRDIGMSYRRIWLLVDRLNADWIEPVVETRVGGGTKSGARLTPFGRSLLNAYREIEARMVVAARGEPLDRLIAMLRPSD